MIESWRKAMLPVWVGFGVFFGLLFCILFAWPTYLEQSEINRNAVDRVNAYAAETTFHVSAKCGNLSGSARRDCAQPFEDRARENQRAELDLASQQVVASWTGAIGIMAVVGAALSGFAALLIWQTWRETKIAASVSEKTYSAFVSVEDARAVVHVSIRFVAGKDVLFALRVSNVGRSTCVLTTITWKWYEGRTFEPDQVFLTTPRTDVIEPAGAVDTEVFRVSGAELKKHPYIGGYVTYDSPLRKKRLSYFCFRFIETGSTMATKYLLDDVRDASWPGDQ